MLKLHPSFKDGPVLTPEEIEEMLFENLPEDYARRALQAVFAASKAAWEDSLVGYHEQERENVRPYMKRAKLEGYLRDIAERFPTVDATVVKGKRSGWWHTEIRSGLVVLTENSVPKPGAMVEMSDFRNNLAALAADTLFGPPETPKDEPESLYVLLIHSRFRSSSDPREERLNGFLPGSAYLAVPDPDLKRYVHTINLFDRFPDVVESNMPATWDEQAKVRYTYWARKGAWRDIAL